MEIITFLHPNILRFCDNPQCPIGIEMRGGHCGVFPMIEGLSVDDQQVIFFTDDRGIIGEPRDSCLIFRQNVSEISCGFFCVIKVNNVK